jgi:hypothetical protein
LQAFVKVRTIIIAVRHYDTSFPLGYKSKESRKANIKEHRPKLLAFSTLLAFPSAINSLSTQTSSSSLSIKGRQTESEGRENNTTTMHISTRNRTKILKQWVSYNAKLWSKSKNKSIARGEFE